MRPDQTLGLIIIALGLGAAALTWCCPALTIIGFCIAGPAGALAVRWLLKPGGF